MARKSKVEAVRESMKNKQWGFISKKTELIEMILCLIIGACGGAYGLHEYNKRYVKNKAVESKLTKNFVYNFKSKDDVKIYAGKWRKGGYLEIQK